ncbi:transglycosylase SLT domain-containing protein [Bombella apis]|nr:transglycosylase SLT domain-containing protein [Bombella apis]
MRWILPCGSPAVWRGAVLGAAILAGNTVFPAQGQALSFPSHVPEYSDGEGHDAPPSSMAGVSLPHPLPATVAGHYRALFAAVRSGDAARLGELTHGPGTDGTAGQLLLPDYLAERYLSIYFTPSESELDSWLRRYPALPDAPLLRQKQEELRRGVSAAAPSAGYRNVADIQQSDRATPFSQTLVRNGFLERDLMDKASSGEEGVRRALAQLCVTPGMSPAYAAQLYGEIAMQALSQGDTRTALRVGSAGLEKGQYRVGLPAFAAGLAAWREGQLDAAYSLFETAANAEQTDGDVQAAASFWAGRVAERHGKTALYRTWLRRTSVQSESFYGLLAGRLLHSEKSQAAAVSGALSTIGRAGAKQASLSEVDINVVASMGEGEHLFALIQLGEQGRAEMLARQMWQDALADPVRAHSLQLVVRKAGMRALADQMEQALAKLDHKEFKDALGPLPDLRPHHGFRLSSALVYAVARMESNFDATASSAAGAYGMMQVRPTTASFVSEQYHLPQTVAAASSDDFNQEMQRRLREPGYNLEVGQLYMLYLAHSLAQGEQSDGASLLKVLASYNAGPQAILRWESGQKGLQDPLMFIECLPSPETRQYVRNVLTNDWVYGRRLHVATPSLVSLADGQWPSFREEEQGRDSPS